MFGVRKVTENFIPGYTVSICRMKKYMRFIVVLYIYGIFR